MTDIPIDNETLKHWGVLGMKWGRRKSGGGTSSSSTSSAKGKAKPKSSDDDDDSSEDHKKVAALKTKKTAQLSNSEIQSIVTRIQLEKQLADVNKKHVSAGQKIVTEILANSAKREAQKFSDQFAAQGADYLRTMVVKKVAKKVANAP